MPLNICLIDSKRLTPWPWECKTHKRATSAGCTLFIARICDYHNQQEATPLLYGKNCLYNSLSMTEISWYTLASNRQSVYVEEETFIHPFIPPPLQFMCQSTLSLNVSLVCAYSLSKQNRNRSISFLYTKLTCFVGGDYLVAETDSYTIAN